VEHSCTKARRGSARFRLPAAFSAATLPTLNTSFRSYSNPGGESVFALNKFSSTKKILALIPVTVNILFDTLAGISDPVGRPALVA
jgi:hypothetical protein